MSISHPTSRWTVTLLPHPDGALFIPIPEAVLARTGWKIGDAIEVSVTPSGAMVLARPIAPIR